MRAFALVRSIADPARLRRASALMLAMAISFESARSQSNEEDVHLPSEISIAPVQSLATRMLGPEQAHDIVSYVTERDALMGFMSAVRFFHTPRPLGDTFCGQAIDHVSLRPAYPNQPEADRPVRIGSVTRGMQIALAPRCRLSAGQRFAYVNPGVGLEAAMAGLRAFAASLQQARSRRRLTFSILWSSNWGDCGDDAEDARRALAALSLDQVLIINGDRLTPSGFVSLTVSSAPGQIYWDVRIADFGTSAARLTMTKRIPAPY